MKWFEELAAALRQVVPPEGEKYYVLASSLDHYKYFVETASRVTEKDLRKRFVHINNEHDLRGLSKVVVIKLDDWWRKGRASLDGIEEILNYYRTQQRLKEFDLTRYI